MNIVQLVKEAQDFLTVHPAGSDPQGADRALAEDLKDQLDAYVNLPCDDGEGGGGGGNGGGGNGGGGNGGGGNGGGGNGGGGNGNGNGKGILAGPLGRS